MACAPRSFHAPPRARPPDGAGATAPADRQVETCTETGTTPCSGDLNLPQLGGRHTGHEPLDRLACRPAVHVARDELLGADQVLAQRHEARLDIPVLAVLSQTDVGHQPVAQALAAPGGLFAAALLEVHVHRL